MISSVFPGEIPGRSRLALLGRRGFPLPGSVTGKADRGLVTKVNLFYNGDIWDIAPVAEDNYSGLSPNIPGGLADRCIALGKGTVLDPFAGEGSIPLAAMRAGRDWLACDMRTDLMRVFEERRLKAGWQI